MSEKACAQCPQLQSEVARLNALVARLNAALELAQHRLAAWRAAVSAAATLIAKELDKPSMALRKLVQITQERLIAAIDADTGRRR